MYKTASTGNPNTFPMKKITHDEFMDLMREYDDFGYDDMIFQDLPNPEAPFNLIRFFLTEIEVMHHELDHRLLYRKEVMKDMADSSD